MSLITFSRRILNSISDISDKSLFLDSIVFLFGFLWETLPFFLYLNFYTVVCVSAQLTFTKIIPVEIIPGMGKEGDKGEWWRG
jgi:hypothetical protein